jgi:hypothetical protein
MECLICKKPLQEIGLIKLPFTYRIKDVEIVIIGNYRDDDFMCLSCAAFQYDIYLKDKE